MKQSHVCPKCRGNRLLHLTQVADTAGSGQQHNPKVRTSAASRAWRLVRSLVESSEYFGRRGVKRAPLLRPPVLSRPTSVAAVGIPSFIPATLVRFRLMEKSCVRSPGPSPAARIANSPRPRGHRVKNPRFPAPGRVGVANGSRW
jgi:hypothetical protein